MVSPPWTDNRAVWFLAHLAGLPGGVVRGLELDPQTREPAADLLLAPDGSWATVSRGEVGEKRTVREGGPVALWEYVEQAHFAWRGYGSPDWSRLGLTVTPIYQRAWIDDPAGPSWPLPGA